MCQTNVSNTNITYQIYQYIIILIYLSLKQILLDNMEQIPMPQIDAKASKLADVLWTT